MWDDLSLVSLFNSPLISCNTRTVQPEHQYLDFFLPILHAGSLGASVDVNICEGYPSTLTAHRS